MGREQEWASLQYQMEKCSYRVHTASKQLVHISNQVSALTVRYGRAEAATQKPICYNYRLRITILEKLRVKIYQYMCQQVNKMKVIEEKLRQITQEGDKTSV